MNRKTSSEKASHKIFEIIPSPFLFVDLIYNVTYSRGYIHNIFRENLKRTCLCHEHPERLQLFATFLSVRVLIFRRIINSKIFSDSLSVVWRDKFSGKIARLSNFLELMPRQNRGARIRCATMQNTGDS